MVEETTPVEAKPELNLTKTLAGAALLLAVISIVFVFAPRTITPSAFLDQGEPFFPDFTDPNVAMTLEVIEFDEETAAARPFKVTNQKLKQPPSIPSSGSLKTILRLISQHLQRHCMTRTKSQTPPA